MIVAFARMNFWCVAVILVLFMTHDVQSKAKVRWNKTFYLFSKLKKTFYSQRGYRVYFSQFTCDGPVNSKYVHNASCSLSARGTGINLNAFTLSDWMDNISLNITIYKKDKDGRETLFFNIPDLSLCRVFQNKYSITIVSMFSELLRKYSNFPLKCPIRKGFYFIKNLRLKGASFPSFLPDMTMVADSMIYDRNNKQHIVTSSIHICVKNK